MATAPTYYVFNLGALWVGTVFFAYKCANHCGIGWMLWGPPKLSCWTAIFLFAARSSKKEDKCLQPLYFLVFLHWLSPCSYFILSSKCFVQKRRGKALCNKKRADLPHCHKSSHLLVMLGAETSSQLSSCIHHRLSNQSSRRKSMNMNKRKPKKWDRYMWNTSIPWFSEPSKSASTCLQTWDTRWKAEVSVTTRPTTLGQYTIVCINS